MHGQDTRSAADPSRGVIARIIAASVDNKFLAILAVGFLGVWGWMSLRDAPLDAIPDLSDTQVIVFTEWPGRGPQLVEDQVTYPISTKLLAAPKVKAVRGQSFFGLSFVYVIFEDGTDMYWARSRVIEYMASAQAELPEGVIPTLGPDATGVGWVFQYALIDRSGAHRPGRPALAPGLHRSLRPRERPRGRRGGLGRRLRQAIPDPFGPGEAAVLRHRRPGGRGRGAGIQPRRRRPSDRAGRSRARGPRPRLRREQKGPRRDPHPRRARRRPGLRRQRRRGDHRTRDAPRAGRARRRGRGRRRHRRDALRRKRPGGDRPGQRADRRAPKGAPGWGRARRHLRSLGAHRGLDRDPSVDADRRDDRGEPDHLFVPAPRAQRPGSGDRAAGRGAVVVYPVRLSGVDRQHHVARGHRGGDRRDGRRVDHHRREHSQVARELGARRPSRSAQRRGRASDAGGRAEHLLLVARHHRVVHAGLYPRGRRGPAVQTAGLRQDLRDGLRRGARGHPDSGARRAADSRRGPRRGEEPAQPLADRHLRTGGALRRHPPARGDRRGADRDDRHRTDLLPAELRVHAAAQRGCDPLHADRAARDVRGGGRPGGPDHGRPARRVSRGRSGLRQDGPGPHRDRSGAAVDGRDRGAAQAARPVAPGYDVGSPDSQERDGREAPNPRDAQRLVDAHPDAHRDVIDRHPQQARGQGLRRFDRADRRRRPPDRNSGQAPRRHPQRVRRAPDRRLLRRLPGQARRGRAPRPASGRRQRHRDVGDRAG